MTARQARVSPGGEQAPGDAGATVDQDRMRAVADELRGAVALGVDGGTAGA